MTQLNYLRYGEEHTTEINVNTLGIIVTGMGEKYLKNFTTKSKGDLITIQKEILKASVERQLPVIFLNQSKEGNIIYSLRKPLENYDLQKTINDYYGKDRRVKSTLSKWNIQNVFLTGTDLISIVDLIHTSLDGIDQIISSPGLLIAPEKNKNSFKLQMDWFEQNEIYLSDHKDLINSIYSKP
jgi:hypothetical protein